VLDVVHVHLGVHVAVLWVGTKLRVTVSSHIN
jgi:hypothetical protein